MSQGFLKEDSSGLVQSVTDDGNGVVIVNNTDAQNPVVEFGGVITDASLSGNGSAGSPLSVASPSGVQSVNDDGNGVVSVDNADPLNPIIEFNGVNTDATITGDGTAGSPLSAVADGVQSVSDDGGGVVSVDNTDPDNPIIEFNGVNTDSTITGDGTAGSPLSAVPDGVQSVSDDGGGVISVDNTDPENPIIDFNGINVDGTFITGDGTSGSPITLGKDIYVPFFFSTTNFNPADGQFYFISGILQNPQTSSDQLGRWYVPVTGEIVYAQAAVRVAGTLGTAAQYQTLSIRLNDTTDHVITSLAEANVARGLRYSNTFSVAVTANTDFLECKALQPTWTTNPTLMILNYYILIKLT